jgi:phosphocarrier protein HPr
VSTARAEVVVTHPTGLHARPAVKLTRLAKTFSASVRLRALPAGEWADAKSMVRVLAMRCRADTRIELAAEGDDAAAAVTALKELVERGFDETGG